jgi:Carboxypeptidase regulatory-like domain
MNRNLLRVGALFALCVWLWPAGQARAQGVTTSRVTGTVTDDQHRPVPGATVTAVHVPSGTTYTAVTRTDGKFDIPGMRVGGPYTVTATLNGFEAQTQENVFLNLGTAADLDFGLKVAAVAMDVTVNAVSDPILTSAVTGATTTVSREALASLPTISGRLESVARLSPESGGGLSFAGQDSRLNNITVDGSYFNNSFGLGNTPGDRTGVAAISLAAIEQIQINVAPYDVRQGNFVGAGVNTVTRSGTNTFSGSAYHSFRDQSMVGTRPKDATFDPGTFSYGLTGFWGAGPIERNRAFFFVSYEDESLTEPGTTFKANTGNEPVGGNTTRVLASDLNGLSAYLKQTFNYDTGPYQDYNFSTPAKRFLVKGDYNLNGNNKVSFRFSRLDSHTDVLESNSSSLGFGSRRTSTFSLNFANSNYQILENIRSGIGEWNAIIGSHIANNFIVGYTHQDESRGYDGLGWGNQPDAFFPLVDILQDGRTYTSFGFEPFTPDNQLRYNTFQLQDNFMKFGDRHTLTFGFTFEKYHSDNVFFPGAQSAYVYNSLEDFYTDVNDYLAHPDRTTSPVTLRRFQVRWNNIPGATEPLQPLDVVYTGAYAQDEWTPTGNVKITAGLRVDVPFFGNTGYDNADADQLTFLDEHGNPVQYQTAKLPDANILWSPRVGFNWNVTGDRRLQVRGGSGIFTGPPAYVWISNQVGNTGTLTGFQQLDNTTARPFNPDAGAYVPADVSGAPPPSYELALTDPNFKFPQIWRSNVGIDRTLPGGFVGSLDFIYNRDVNGIYYINANLTPANASFTGPDTRPRWTGSNRINANVTDAVVLKNESVGRSWNIAASANKTFRNTFFLKAGYSYGQARNTVDAGSIAFGSWNNNQHVGDPNNPGLGFSGSSPGHRFFIATTYRAEYFSFGATTVSLFLDGHTNGNTSYTFSGDLNGDGGTSNDLIYIPRNTSEMNFQTFTSGGVTYTSAQQAAAWEAYISQDPYLSRHRGQYAERGAVFLPMVWRADLSLAQEIFHRIGANRPSFEVRVDILNVGNLLNHNWGVGQRLVTTQPLIVPSASQGGPADAQGRTQYRLAVVGGRLLSSSFEQTAGIDDVYKILVSFRATFN